MSMMETSMGTAPVPLNFQPIDTPAMREEQAPSKVDGDGLSMLELSRFLEDIRDEPEWRTLANRCADYYDHNQLSDDVLAEYRRLGLPPFVIDLIHPTINTVLGMEAKTRTDWQVTFDDEQFEPVALALNKKTTEAERMSQADRAISNAYAGQIKAGLAWAEVGWNSNPFGYRYRVRDVHRREIWWDYRTREIEEWRYLVRKQRFDADRLLLAFPKMREMINSAVEGGTTWQEYCTRIDAATGLGQFIDLERAMMIEDQEWISSNRRQLGVFEVWYRKYITGYVARLGETVIEIDEKNPRHMLAIAHGAMNPIKACYPKLRQAIFIGAHRVLDRASPYPHRKLPYVPFFGYREDMTGIPYGLIRGMLSSQDDINMRRAKAHVLLNSRRVEADEDAVATKYNSHNDAADEASRHNSYIVLNPNRKNKDGFKVEDNQDLAVGQAQVLQEAKQEIHQTSGVFPPMAGDNKGSLSGLAINSLVEQGTQTLAEINDNYTWARREVGELVLELVKYDSMHEHTVKVGEGKAAKTITLNKRATTWDNNTGEPVTVENSVASAAVKLILDDVPSTPAWRQQQSAQLAEITKSLPPQLQAFVVPFYMESTDIRDRKKIAKILRAQLGIPEPGAEGEDGQEDPRIAQMQADHEAAVQELTGQLQQAMESLQKLELANRDKQAEVAVKAKAADAKAEVDQQNADTERQAVDDKAEIERLKALATLHKAEDPKGTQTPVAEGMQDAIEEMIATMRAGFQEFHGRLSAIEKASAKAPPTP